MQLRGGRIVLPFAMLTHRTWRDRGEGLDAFWFAGTSSTTAVFSDDGGETWQQAPAELKVQTPSIGTYGAVEPVALELADGRAWMLIRTQVGRFYESFSDDGARWSRPRPLAGLFPHRVPSRETRPPWPRWLRGNRAERSFDCCNALGDSGRRCTRSGPPHDRVTRMPSQAGGRRPGRRERAHGRNVSFST